MFANNFYIYRWKYLSLFTSDLCAMLYEKYYPEYCELFNIDFNPDNAKAPDDLIKRLQCFMGVNKFFKNNFYDFFLKCCNMYLENDAKIFTGKCVNIYYLNVQHFI